MLRDITFPRLVAMWFGLVAVFVTASIALGFVPTLMTTIWIVGAAIALPAVLYMIWRGAPPPTVAELLHSVTTDDRSR
jgi:hypothetical protein